jgi:hypothetical protein
VKALSGFILEGGVVSVVWGEKIEALEGVGSQGGGTAAEGHCGNQNSRMVHKNSDISKTD